MVGTGGAYTQCLTDIYQINGNTVELTMPQLPRWASWCLPPNANEWPSELIS